MKLQHYLDRIHYQASLQPTVETLRQLHRAHLLAIPYENLDIHLGRRLTLDSGHIYHKIVEQRRGGWCYEMNGLFAWVLRELGFDVTMLGSSVGAPARGGVDGDLDHLILLVQFEEPWLADVGFGNGLLEPIPLCEGTYQQGGFLFRLEQQGDTWFLHNHAQGGPGIGFTLLNREYAGFAPRCHELQTSPESGFVKSTVCHRYIPDSSGSNAIVSLRGAVLKHYRAEGTSEEEIETLARYQEVFQTIFDLDGALADQLWEGVQKRHVEWKQLQG